MIIKTYHYYIIRKFIKKVLLVSAIFLSLIFFLNIFTEIKFLENYKVEFYFPVMLTALNTPSLVFETFPFIFFIATQLFFIDFYDNQELIIFKNFGIDNLKFIKIISIISFCLGVLICLLFYNLSAGLKSSYLIFKNNFSKDNTYLAVVNENGLWIRDESNENIKIINAESFSNNLLNDISISVLNKKFYLIKTLKAKSAKIQNKEWILEKVYIFNDDGSKNYFENYKFKTNFDKKKINSLFSNLTSLNIFELMNLKKDYINFGYSTLEIENHLHKLYSFPLYIVIMCVLSGIFMFNVKHNQSKTYNIIAGMLFSVLIYYLNYFSNLLGVNERVPILLSNAFPLLILILICIIGMIKLNEK